MNVLIKEATIMETPAINDKISTPIEPAITEPASILATYKTTQTYRQPYKTVLGQTYYVVYREKL